VPDRRIISIPSTPRGAVPNRAVAGHTAPKAAERQADFSIRLLGEGRLLALADVYLYRPPFLLDRALTYGSSEGKMQELFTMPGPGWGVLRSSAGVLLWLAVKQESGQPSNQGVELQLMTSSSSGEVEGKAPVVSGTGRWSTSFSTARPLAADQGILRMVAGELYLSLESMDDVLKTWLGFVQTGTSTSVSL